MPEWVKRNLVRLAVLVPLAVVFILVRNYVTHVRPEGHVSTQRVTLMNQPKAEAPKPPPPEPKEVVREPKPQDPSQPFQKFEDYGPGDDSPQGPRDDNLGLDTEGAGSGDSYGLVGKRGAQDITTLGPATVGGQGPQGRGHGGAMAKFAGYATMVKNSMASELNRHDSLRTANYDAVVMVWIDEDGRIKRIKLAKSTGIAKMDEDLREALSGMPALSLPPPSEMPQPIDLRIVSKGARTEAD